MSLSRKFLTFASVAVVSLLGGGFASAATSGTQTVSYTVVATRSITVAGDTVALGNIATTDTSGVEQAGSTTSASVAWSTDDTNDKITVQVAALATGLDLFIKGDNVDDATPACTGSTEGSLAVGDDTYTSEIETERDFVTGINNCTGSTTKADVDTLTYKLTSSGASIAGSTSKTVTFTIKAA